MRTSRDWMPALLMAAMSLAAGGSPAAEPASETFAVGGVKIHYLIGGQGDPVVLIHGLHSSAEINWRRTGVFDALAQRHRTIALDLPGHGLSDKPVGEQAYGLAVVDDLVALLDHLKIEKAHIVGYSLGGMVAVKFLARHPQRALSSVIGGMGWLREGSRLQRFWEQIPARDASRTPPALLHTIGQLAVSAEELRKIDVPVEIVVGDRDPVKRMYVAPLRLARPDWAVVEIEGAGHLTSIVKPQFREAIVDWLRK